MNPDLQLLALQIVGTIVAACVLPGLAFTVVAAALCPAPAHRAGSGPTHPVGIPGPGRTP